MLIHDNTLKNEEKQPAISFPAFTKRMGPVAPASPSITANISAPVPDNATPALDRQGKVKAPLKVHFSLPVSTSPELSSDERNLHTALPRERTMHLSSSPTPGEEHAQIVAGHRQNFSSLKGGKILRKETNANEADFYRALMADKENPLHKIVPPTQVMGDGNTIEMDNLFYGMKNPQVLDVKIGKRILSETVLNYQSNNRIYNYFHKRITKMFDKILGSDRRGWRITGGSGLNNGKLYNGTHSETLLNQYLENMAKKPELLDKLEGQLNEIKSVVAACPYAFLDSSIVIAFDDKEVRAKLLDFAYAFKNDPQKPKLALKYPKYRKRFASGMDSLLKDFAKDKKTALKRENQLAAGHKSKLSFVDGGKALLKVTQAKELELYQGIHHGNKDSLARVTPVPFSFSPEQSQMKMENVLFSMKNPKVLDIKMGPTTSSLTEMKDQGYNLPHRLFRKSWTQIKNSLLGSKSRGWRIDGGSGIGGNKFTRGFASQQLLKDYLTTANLTQPQKLQLLEKLNAVKDCSKTSNYALLDSSLFIAIDENKKIQVKIIDLAHGIRKDAHPALHQKYVTNYQRAVDGVIRDVKRVLQA